MLFSVTSNKDNEDEKLLEVMRLILKIFRNSQNMSFYKLDKRESKYTESDVISMNRISFKIPFFKKVIDYNFRDVRTSLL